LVLLGVTVSLLYFNRDPGWDAWAPYFFGSYGLGALACWIADRRRRPSLVVGLLFVIVAVTLVALAIDFRSRIAVALLTALALATLSRYGLMHLGQRIPCAAFLGKISYSVFLVHFPVCLIVNAAFTRFASAAPWAQAIGMAIAWGASVAAGAAFHRWVEQPLVSIGLNRSRQSAPQNPIHVKTDVSTSMDNRR
jgi:peptidoglycan/LPS O-acetylase OafA/YrhL